MAHQMHCQVIERTQTGFNGRSWTVKFEPLDPATSPRASIVLEKLTQKQAETYDPGKIFYLAISAIPTPVGQLHAHEHAQQQNDSAFQPGISEAAEGLNSWEVQQLANGKPI